MSKKPVLPGKFFRVASVVSIVGLLVHGLTSSVLLRASDCSSAGRIADIVVLTVLLATATVSLGKFASLRRIGYVGVLVGLFSLWILGSGIVHRVALTQMLAALTLDAGLFWVFLITRTFAGRTPKNSWVLKMCLVFGGLAVVSLGLYFVGLQDNLDRAVGFGQCGSQASLLTAGTEGLIRSRGFARNPNELGALLIPALTIILYSLIVQKGKRSKWQIGLCIALGLLEFLTFSRSAWIGSAVALGLVIIPLWKQLSSKLRIAGLVTILLGSLLLISVPGFRNQFLLHKSTDSNSTAAHFNAKTSGVRTILEQPGGSGPGTAGAIGGIFKQPNVIETESTFLNIGVQYGIVGLALFLCLIGVMGYLLYTSSHPLAYAVFCSFIGLIVMGLVIPVFSTYPLVILFGFLVGFVAPAKPPRVSSSRGPSTPNA